MALQRDAKYPGRFDAASAGQPQGAFKNRTSPTAEDGSYIEKQWLNDFSGLFSSVLDNAGYIPNNTVDQVGASQYFDAVLLLAIAAGLNTPTATVILSSDTTTVLDVKVYIHAIGPQVTWEIPTLNGAGETIISVAGDQLETTGGTYTLKVVSTTTGLGLDQTWQDLTLSRASAVVYTNNTDGPIMVSASVFGTNADANLYVNGDLVTNFGPLTGTFAPQAVVPAGNTYNLDVLAGALGSWWELRA